MKIRPFLFLFILPLMAGCGKDGTGDAPGTSGGTDTPGATVSQYILAAQVTNKESASIVFDNQAKTVTVSLPGNAAKNDVRIRLWLNDGVAMEYPSTEEAEYDFTKSNVGVWLKVGQQSVVFTMHLQSADVPESPVGKATARDMCLIYDSHWTSRPVWNEQRFAPYVSVSAGSSQHDWLFDGFLFIEYRDASYGFAHGYGLKDARKEQWTQLVSHYTGSGGVSMHALDSHVGKIREKAPGHGIHKVVITLPEPIKNQTDWGEVDGNVLNFTRDADRIIACKWYIDHAIGQYKKAGFKNIQLTGFYWVAEGMNESRTIIHAIADYIHSKNLNFYWIPYFNANGYSEWASFGFDEAWLQPNYFFYGDVPKSRLDEACQKANQYSMSNEMEFDGRARQGNDPAFRQKMLDYIEAFTRNNVFRDKNITYYEGGDGWYSLKNGLYEDIQLYNQLANIIVERQKQYYR
jgi:hypothetical protein